MSGDFDTPLEWNSNQLVLVRTNQIIDRINVARNIRNITQLLDGIVDLYKEISVDLKPKEEEIWEDIVKVIKRYQPSNPNEHAIGNLSNDGLFLAELDVIDLRLRKLAKIHGYLASNKEDPRRAISQR